MKFRLHHIGIVVADVDRYLDKRVSGTVTIDVMDETQDARIVLLNHGDLQPITELIQPMSDRATTAGFLKRKGGGYHHLCYEAASVTEVEEYFQESGIKTIYGPVSASALGNQLVLFGYTRNREIIEFVVNHAKNSA